MNRIFNEGVSNSVSRVSPLNSSGVQKKCRQSCDISSSGPPDGRQAARRPHTNKTANYSFSFNGIFESKPRSESSVASDSTGSPDRPTTPMVAVEHSQPSSPVVDRHDLKDDRITDESDKNHKRGRKRKHKEVSLTDLSEKMDAARRLQRAPTTDELAHKFNIEVTPSDVTDSRIVTTFRTNKMHNRNVSEVNFRSKEPETKSDIMKRFFSSQSSNTSPAIQEDIDLIYNSYGEPPMTSAQSVSSGHCVPHPSVSDRTSYPFAKTSSHLQLNQTRNQTQTDSVSLEIDMILSQLPPLRHSDTVWSDCEHEDDQSSDNELRSVHSDYKMEDRDHNHRREAHDSNSDQLSNDSRLSSNSKQWDKKLEQSHSRHKAIQVTDYEVEKYCEQRWESVNGTYDSETEWRPWNQMVSQVSYNGDLLHILPYVDIYSEPDRTADQFSDPSDTIEPSVT